MAQITQSQTLSQNGERTRVGGSAFSVFLWQSAVIGFAQQISDVSPTPVGTGATPIMTLDAPYAVEIVTPAALNPGTLTLELYERYNKKVWDDLTGLTGATDLAEIFIRIASLGPGGLQVAKVIRPPVLGPNSTVPLSTLANGNGYYTQFYNGCVVSNVEDGETIQIGTMAVTKRITLMYTNTTYNGFGRTFSPNGLAEQLASNPGTQGP